MAKACEHSYTTFKCVHDNMIESIESWKKGDQVLRPSDKYIIQANTLTVRMVRSNSRVTCTCIAHRARASCTAHEHCEPRIVHVSRAACNCSVHRVRRFLPVTRKKSQKRPHFLCGSFLCMTPIMKKNHFAWCTVSLM